MKKLLLFLLISILGSGMQAEAQNQRPIKIRITLSFDVAAPRRDCQSGFGICHFNASPGRMVSTGLNIENGALVFYFNRSTMSDVVAAEFIRNTYFPVDDATTIDADVWAKLGERNERSLRPGNYKIETTADYYIVSVPLE